MISLIEYMYTGCLKEPSNPEAFILLLCLADRFSIHSCMGPLVKVFQSYPQTVHNCHLMLCLPETLKSNKTVYPIVKSCRKFLCEQFQDISSSSHRSELLSLSMEVFKVVLESELLDVQYKEEVFICLSNWTKVL